MAKKSKTVEFQYDVLGGIGSANLANGRAAPLNGQEEGKEESYIPLLDVVTDTGTGSVRPELTPEAPQNALSTSQPARDKEEPSTSGRKELPWSRASQQMQSPTLRLHHEVVEFCRFLEPTQEEDEARKEALSRISDIVCSMFPSAEVKVFGSYVTGLYLPTSDMDLVVINSGCTDIPRALRAIGNLLVENQMAKNIQVIASATVPIIKFDDVGTGLAFDISFDVANGPKTAKLVSDLMDSLPPMRHLAIILKLFLQQRDMNEVYQGGIGSYALLVMVASFLLQHPSRMPTSKNRKPQLEANMGILLLDFFRLYGRSLKCEEVAISCRNGGSYFRKRDNQKFLQRGERQSFLAIEDPQDPTNDLAKGSYNINRVQKAFDFAYKQLSSPINPEDSTLERIIRLDAVLLSRVPRPEIEQRPHSGKSSAASGRTSGSGHSSKRGGAQSMSEGNSREGASPSISPELQKDSRQLSKAQKKAAKRKRSKERTRETSHSTKPAKQAKRLRERELEFGDYG